MNNIDKYLLQTAIFVSLSIFITSFITIVIEKDPVPSANFMIIISSVITVIAYILLYGFKERE